jgi:hypothetical protein
MLACITERSHHQDWALTSVADPYHVDAEPDPAFHLDADPDPETTSQNYADQCGSGSTTLALTLKKVEELGRMREWEQQTITHV